MKEQVRVHGIKSEGEGDRIHWGQVIDGVIYGMIKEAPRGTDFGDGDKEMRVFTQEEWGGLLRNMKEYDCDSNNYGQELLRVISCIVLKIVGAESGTEKEQQQLKSWCQDVYEKLGYEGMRLRKREDGLGFKLEGAKGTCQGSTGYGNCQEESLRLLWSVMSSLGRLCQGCGLRGVEEWLGRGVKGTRKDFLYCEFPSQGSLRCTEDSENSSDKVKINVYSRISPAALSPTSKTQEGEPLKSPMPSQDPRPSTAEHPQEQQPGRRDGFTGKEQNGASPPQHKAPGAGTDGHTTETGSPDDLTARNDTDGGRKGPMGEEDTAPVSTTTGAAPATGPQATERNSHAATDVSAKSITQKTREGPLVNTKDGGQVEGGGYGGVIGGVTSIIVLGTIAVYGYWRIFGRRRRARSTNWNTRGTDHIAYMPQEH
ncbi:hypothetical protein C922_03465 [Plasmodium inui San Antonio 1]|uniref:Uncharacterized protein n=1 Tax=Plasmodium inui San Antonio 1 TaxID=1237626 RepID=W7A3P9_9APIC|nr:hypothetical protein C922_03465 [Plasmodium inui San Antonio 1]EUD66270.1 hypothetical protein C922_03465 [Plasmodium inui San Antonio 1]